MFDSFIREAKERIQEPIANQLAYIHPTMITVLAFAVGIVGAILIIEQHYFAGMIFWLLNRILDGFDGTVARVHQKQSDLGGYIDILLDFAIYAIIPVALVIAAPSQSKYLALAFLLSTFYINSASWMYLSGILEKRQHTQARDKFTSVNMPSGLVCGTETVIFYCLFIVAPQMLTLWYVCMGILVLFTVAQRLVWAVQNLD